MTLQVQEQADKTARLKAPEGATILLTPPIGEDYWLFRVDVGHGQAVIGFPKFCTIGIGFQDEGDDWNTNLPYTCETVEIFNHIKCNKGNNAIRDEDCTNAIAIIQEAAGGYLEEKKEDGQ